MTDLVAEAIARIEAMFAELKRDVGRVIEIQRMLGEKLEAMAVPRDERAGTSASQRSAPPAPPALR
jgi:hypothetical protein